MSHIIMPGRITFIFVALLCGIASAAESMPPPPSQYVSDSAGVLNNAGQLNRELEQFERDTSNQILVAVFPRMQSDSSIEDYTYRIASNWKAGSKKKDNGAILFVFMQDRKMFIQVGYGLEGALPDALCRQIIEQEIKPHFAQADFSGGVAAGIHAMMAATRGEYKGNGTTVRNGGHGNRLGIPPIVLLVIVLIIFSFIRRATTYGYSGRRRGWYFASDFYLGWLGGMLSSGGGRGGGGGNWGGGGGGGFSGGGGSFGGGGAGGSW